MTPVAKDDNRYNFLLQDDTNEKEKDSKDEKKEKKKEKKEKKEKKPKEKKEKGPSCIDTLTSGLNLNDRDDKAINAEINVSHKKTFFTNGLA
jgi:hypothetical protein